MKRCHGREPHTDRIMIHRNVFYLADDDALPVDEVDIIGRTRQGVEHILRAGRDDISLRYCAAGVHGLQAHIAAAPVVAAFRQQDAQGRYLVFHRHDDEAFPSFCLFILPHRGGRDIDQCAVVHAFEGTAFYTWRRYSQARQAAQLLALIECLVPYRLQGRGQQDGTQGAHFAERRGRQVGHVGGGVVGISQFLQQGVHAPVGTLHASLYGELFHLFCRLVCQREGGFYRAGEAA